MCLWGAQFLDVGLVARGSLWRTNAPSFPAALPWVCRQGARAARSAWRRLTTQLQEGLSAPLGPAPGQRQGELSWIHPGLPRLQEGARSPKPPGSWPHGRDPPSGQPSCPPFSEPLARASYLWPSAHGFHPLTQSDERFCRPRGCDRDRPALRGGHSPERAALQVPAAHETRPRGPGLVRRAGPYSLVGKRNTETGQGRAEGT